MDLKKRAAEWNPADIIGGIGGAQAGTSVFRNIDARILLPAAFVVILALSAAKRWYVPGAVFVVVFFTTMYTAPSRKSYLKLLVYPILIAMFIFIVQACSSAYGSTVVLAVIWPIYAQGIASGWLYANRVLASVSILLLLVESKSQLELIEALRWFKVPIEIRNLMSLMFRYVSVLSEEFSTMFHAQQARLGFSAKLSWLKKLHNMSIIAGMLVIRSYDRSYRVEKSMMARGYAQNVDICRTFNRFARKDYLAAAFALAVVASIVLVGVVM
jgi:cobalt/nickel transport system permease protein